MDLVGQVLATAWELIAALGAVAVMWGKLQANVNGLGERTNAVERKVEKIDGQLIAVVAIDAKLDDVRDRLARIERRMDRAAEAGA